MESVVGCWSGSGAGLGTIRLGNDERTRTVPTPSKTSKGINRTVGCFSSGVWHWAQIGTAPGGGRKTIAGPQQHDGQRYRGICSNAVF
ncbi:hypothetical protein [Synechococcus sp. MIT S1220]|uniref:hypothetical protein n=1 Tax=Synechococcus sp. MIT S1220 TaxID=3082549 RepID=UPI0039AF6CA5